MNQACQQIYPNQPWMVYDECMPPSRKRNLDAERFGAILLRLRRERGWTRRKLATRCGLTPQYLSILEWGGNVPSLSTVLELTEVLGADVGEIMRQLAAARNAPPQAPPPVPDPEPEPEPDAAPPAPEP